MSDEGTDRRWMEQALALAVLGEGTTSPNPRVGCVVVRDGKAIGKGFHRRAGEPHAEAVALAEAGEGARGATLYVNLEPCAHVGRTPPCADRIVGAGVSRVVAALVDPNPLVDGKGLRRLREAGIEVVCGVLPEEAERLNAPFLTRHRLGRPFVTLKGATSLDGRIAARDGSATWITGEPARRFAHRLRLRHDAVLVGAATVRRDDPRLDVRLPGVDAPRLRVVLSTTGALDPGSRVFRGEGPRTVVYVASGGDAIDSVADVVRVPAGSAGVDLHAVLADLAARGIVSVLVEGGGKVHASFLAGGLADRIAVFTAPSLLGAAGATSLVDLPAVSTPDAGYGLDSVVRLPLGRDQFLSAVPRPPCSRG